MGRSRLPCSAQASPRRRGSRSSRVSEPQRRRPAPRGAVHPPRAGLGAVHVPPDSAKEIPDGDAARAETFATLIRTGESLFDELDRTMLATFDANQQMLNPLAVIEGAHEPLTPTQIGERTYKS